MGNCFLNDFSYFMNRSYLYSSVTASLNSPFQTYRNPNAHKDRQKVRVTVNLQLTGISAFGSSLELHTRLQPIAPNITSFLLIKILRK